MKKVLTVVLLAAVFCSCQKSSNSTNPTSTDTLATKSFEQLNAGTYWKYAFRTGTDSSTAKSDTVKLTVLSADSTVGAHTYKVISDSLKKYNFFYRNVADSEFRRGLFTSVPGHIIPDIEEKYFINNVSVGLSWVLPISIPYSGTNFVVNNSYQVISLNDSLTVAEKTYQHVAHVHLNILLNTTSIGSGDFYYARGYGSIKYQLSVSFALAGLNFYQSQVLLDSQIK